MTLPNLGLFLLLGGLPAIVLLTFTYGIFSGWRSTLAGRALFWFILSLTVITVHFAGVIVFGDYEGRYWVRLAVFGLFFVCSWRFFISYLKVRFFTSRPADIVPPTAEPGTQKGTHYDSQAAPDRSG